MSNAKVQMPKEIQSSNDKQKQRKNGMMEHWNTGLIKTILGFSRVIPSFQYSNIPELSFQILVILTFL
jgi:hypothetical protein